ncbi:MAG TPA: hypothetical protein VLO10_03620 [Candidatus Deferrimicrobium sp.]|nr:hypothetical protein [Candidatus Deferrimicrobium sp.]
MSAGWVAGTVRARALVAQLPAPSLMSEVAACVSLDRAADRLEETVYGEHVHPGMSGIELQRALATAVLWRLRVLAGWVPLGGAALVRALAGWFEIRAIEERLAALHGASVPPPYAMGRLGVVASKAASATSVEALRRLLAPSVWGDPGDMAPAPLRAHLLARWAARLRREAPEARPWVDDAVALSVMRDVRAGRRASPAASEQQSTTTAALWSAEQVWWDRVAVDARRMLHARLGSREVVVGACALMAVDAHHMSSAIELAAGGGGSLETIDAIA